MFWAIQFLKSYFKDKTQNIKLSFTFQKKIINIKRSYKIYNAKLFASIKSFCH